MSAKRRPKKASPRTSNYKASGETPARRFAGIKVRPKRKPPRTSDYKASGEPLGRRFPGSKVRPKRKPLRTADYKSGGETPVRRFAGIKVKRGYEQKGDIDRPPFESHPNHGPNKARPQHRTRDVDTAGQHGQRPTHMPRKKKKPGV